MRKGERGWGGEQTEEDLRAPHTKSEAEQLTRGYVVAVRKFSHTPFIVHGTQMLSSW